MRPATDLEVRVHASLAEIDPREWDALTATPPASINVSRDWVAAALATVDRDADPFLIAVRAGGRLLGLLPLVERTANERPVLRFAGAPHNDMTDALVLPGREPEAAAALLESLCSLAAERSLDLDQLDPSGALAGADRERPRLAWSHAADAPVVDLRSAWECAASPRRRRRWEGELRSLRRDCRVAFRWLERDDALAALPGFERRRELRLREKQRPLDQPPLPLLEAAVGRLAPAGRCAFAELLLDGEPVASDLYMLDRPVAMAWLRALHPDRPKASCGHLLMRETARDLAARGYTALDLGRGEEPYKFLFGARSRRLLRARGLRPAPR